MIKRLAVSSAGGLTFNNRRSNPRLGGSLISGLMLLTLGACSANHHSIYRNRPVPDGSVVTIDAKQRGIIMRNKKVCTEPSPDVFAVLAQAFSGTGSFAKGADPTTLSLGLSAAFSSAEQGSTIARTQTINMLREAMYQTCLRSLNQDIGTLEMPIQAARDQRMMVSTLAIEQLTGAVMPKPTIIGAGGSASAAGGGGDSAVRVDEAYKALQSAESTTQSRQTEYDELEGAEPKCSALATKKDAGTEITDTAEIAKLEKCTKAKLALATAKEAKQEAAQHYNDLREIALKGGTNLEASTNVSDASGGGGIERADAASVKEVAVAVRDIVAMNFDQDETKLMCIRILSGEGAQERKVASQSPGIKESCTTFLLAQVALAEEKTLDLLSVSRQQELRSQRVDVFDRFDALANQSFPAFWLAVQNPADASRADAALLRQRIEAVRAQRNIRSGPIHEKLVALEAALSQADSRVVFESLPAWLQSDLALQSVQQGGQW